MLANRIRFKSQGGESTLPFPFEWATDDDFSGSTNGSFRYVGTKEYVAIPSVIKGVNVTSYSNMFQSNNKIKGVLSFNSNVTTMNSMFYGCSSLTSLDLINFDTSSVTNMTSMFHSCSSLTSLDLSNFNTSNVTYMQAMFRACSSLTSLDLSNFNTSNVTTMSEMFYECKSLTSLDLSSFDTSNVTNVNNMFMLANSISVAYARTQSDANKLNASTNKPTRFTFVVKPTI